jgi:PAS domain S-box-containing protein
MLGMVLVFRDISPDYEAQEAIRRNEEIFRTLFADAHTPILLIDPESGAIDEANRASARFYGWSVDALRSMNIADINVLSPQEIAREMRMAAESDRKEFRFIHRLSCGEERLVLVASGPISIGGAKKLLSIVRDASDAQMMEAELVAEKGRSRIIRRDAQHRMKNSAQLISSLIEIQASSLEDEATAGALRDLQNRVNGLGLVYDKLYVRDEEEHVASADYLSSLLDAIESGYVPRAVRLSRRIEEAELEARFAVSLGLIVGELVMNACKYAFPSEAKGSITVAFSRSPGDRLSLVVSDDGIGIDAARRIQGDSAREGTGLSLVRSLVAQEKGDIEIDMEGKGTSIACSFPLNRR